MKTRTEKRWICAVLSIVLLLAYIPATPAQADATGMILEEDKETLTIAQDTVLDLNGYTVTELNVTNGTVYVKDSKTDDYTVADDKYGKIVAATGAVKAQEGYMAIQEDGGTSYHKVDLTITAMSLRSFVDGEAKPGVYYKSAFKGDEKVAANVDSYGIALSLYNNPTADGSNKNSAYSKFTEFKAGPEGNSGNGTLLSGIMKTENSNEINQRNAEYQVYGRSYLKTKSGDYIYGNCVNRSLKQQLEAIAGMWKTYNTTVQNTVLGLCKEYMDVVSTWDNLSEITWQLEETNVAKPITTLEDLKNIDVATNEMTKKELRQLCIDFMSLQMTFSWTPRQTTTYYNGGTGFADGQPYNMEHGTVYKGMPYKGSGIGGNGHGNIYTVLEYYNPSNGMLNTNVWKDGTLDMAPFTSQCSSSTFWAWARVCNSFDYQYTKKATPANGFIPVGTLPYLDFWSADLTEYTEDDNTQEICDHYDDIKETKADFYAKGYAHLKAGDGLLSSDDNGGHIRMVVSVNLKDVNGGSLDEGEAISGEHSTVTVLEQEMHWLDKTKEYGSPCKVARGGTVREIKFYSLKSSGYIPFTFAELVDEEMLKKDPDYISSDFMPMFTEETSKVEAATYSINCDEAAPMTKKAFEDLQVTSNYAISDITFVIKNANGMAVCREFVPAHMWSIKKSINLFDLTNTIAEGDGYKKILNIEDYSEYFDGNHTIEISAQLSNGEKPPVYTGTLVAG